MRSPRLLSHTGKAELLALLLKRGADQAACAFRLARLRESPCREIRVSMTFEGRSVHFNPPFHLEPVRDRLGRLVGGTLYVNAGANLAAYSLGLARALGDYLGDLRLEEPIALFLISPPALLLRDRGVSGADVLEAEDALRRHRKAQDEGEPLTLTTGKVEEAGEPVDLEAAAGGEPASPGTGGTSGASGGEPRPGRRRGGQGVEITAPPGHFS